MLEDPRNPNYPLKHLSIRVPWHDNKWNGTVCNSPKANSSCLVLENCAKNRKDDFEMTLAGKELKVIQSEGKQLPPCVSERATFMSPDSLTVLKSHPYTNKSKEGSIYHNLGRTELKHIRYSAAAVPFHWMNTINAKDKIKSYRIDFDLQREPFINYGKEYNWTKTWIQTVRNQKALLDCFFDHIEPLKSLVFFYAKQVPFVESNERVVVGVGFVKGIAQNSSFPSDSGFTSMLWEHTVEHTIREEKKDGFLLPYHEALEYQIKNPDFDADQLAIKVPNEFRFQFSYGSEHVTNDTALWVLKESKRKIELAKKFELGDNWENAEKWIQDRIAEIELLRGDYPGLGSALISFGIEYGFYLAQYLFKSKPSDQDVWDYLDHLVESRDQSIREFFRGDLFEQYELMSQSHRKKLLQILSRFELSSTQCSNVFSIAKDKYLDYDEKQIINNPYILYEASMHSADPISFYTIDNGLMINRSRSLYPERDKSYTPSSKERIRALIVQELEKALIQGHTLLTEDILKTRIANLPLDPALNLTIESFDLAKSIFLDKIKITASKNGKDLCQLTRINKCSDFIKKTVVARLSSTRYLLNFNWEEKLNEFFEGKPLPFIIDDEILRSGINEKSLGLAELFESPFSVLIGPAGTGKTTLLNIFCATDSIRMGGVLVLTPTGKSRVRVEQLSDSNSIEVKTIAQFLLKFGRYNPSQQRYILDPKAPKESSYKTLIIDESSMLTEEMMASTFESFSGLERIILVGDPRQLPPIGGGRPFVDIIDYLKPSRSNNKTKVTQGYVELSVGFRSHGPDQIFADFFSGESNEDSIDLGLILSPPQQSIQVLNWNSEEEFYEVFDSAMNQTFSVTDSESFNNLQGATSLGKDFKKSISTPSIEQWQILSPVRGHIHGTRGINRYLHEKYRKLDISAFKNNFKLPQPYGTDEIIYGDKVICLQNLRQVKAFPEKQENYIANGELGLVVGYSQKLKIYNVEFASQLGYTYGFSNILNGEESDPLELAYALTIHKAQGSEFDKILVILPYPCFNISRELIYTALTRQKKGLTILYQGQLHNILRYRDISYSDTYNRFTNIFFEPNIIEVSTFDDGHSKQDYFDINHIQCASDGTKLISKSELVIYEALRHAGLNPVYEKEMTIEGRTIKPDFTIAHPFTGQQIYWEHLGMLSNPLYRDKWLKKKDLYEANGIVEDDNLIISHDDPFGGLSMKEVYKKISLHFDSSIEGKDRDLIKRINEPRALARNVMPRENLLFESLQKEIGHLKRELKEDNQAIDQKLTRIREKIDSRLTIAHKKNYLKKAKKNIPLIGNLEDRAKELLADSYFLYDMIKKSERKQNYDSFILQHIRVIELDLNQKLFASFLEKTRNDRGENLKSYLSDDLENSKTGLFARMILKGDSKFTLGNMVFILSLISRETGSSLSKSSLLQDFRLYVLNVLKEEFLTGPAVSDLDQIVNEYRNGAAHDRSYDKKEASDYKVKAEAIFNRYLENLI